MGQHTREVNECLSKLKDNDLDAMELLITKTQRLLYMILRGFFHRDQDIADAMQETYIRVYQNIHKYKSHHSGMAWISKIAKNIAVDILRKRKYEQNQYDVSNTEIADPNHDSVQFKDLLHQIHPFTSPLQRSIIIMHLVEGYTFMEIGTLLDLSTSNTKYHYQKAMENIRKHLDKEDFYD